MLQTKQLSFTYDGKTILSFPDIDCQKGQQYLILGQSGSGKTTLLHLLGGLRKAQQGQVIIAGTNISDLSTSGLDKFRGENIGIIFQQAHFASALTVEENLLLAPYLVGRKQSKARVFELLDRLNIGHKLKEKTGALSVGEQQRVAIARALMNKPSIILADEPTSALDDINCEEVIQLLETQAREENATLLIVTHDGRLKERFENKIILE